MNVLLRARVLVTKDGQPFECQVTSADGTTHSVWPKLEDVVTDRTALDSAIGNVLDHWEQVPNDLQGDPGYENLHEALKQLYRAREIVFVAENSGAPAGAAPPSWAKTNWTYAGQPVREDKALRELVAKWRKASAKSRAAWLRTSEDDVAWHTELETNMNDLLMCAKELESLLPREGEASQPVREDKALREATLEVVKHAKAFLKVMDDENSSCDVEWDIEKALKQAVERLESLLSRESGGSET
jgi:hypothetical protein